MPPKKASKSQQRKQKQEVKHVAVAMPDKAAEQAKSDPDPIVKTYDVYIKPQISADKNIYVLQFPNQVEPYGSATQSQPVAFRTKPSAGMVEVDVPINVWNNFDRAKGVKWGEATRYSNKKGEGNYGMPAGFGIGTQQGSGRERGRTEIDENADQQSVLENFSAAVERDQVMKKLTLGGQTLPDGVTQPRYMVGSFKNGNELHLTPVDHVVQLRSEFHHVDAQTEQKRAGRPRDMTAAGGRVQEARAVHMMVKSSIDGEDTNTTTMNARLQESQGEKWRKHRYIDENSEEAWATYDGNLFIRPQSKLGKAQSLAHLPRLESDMYESQYLNSLSAPRATQEMPRSKRARKQKGGISEGQAEAEGNSSMSESEAEG